MCGAFLFLMGLLVYLPKGTKGSHVCPNWRDKRTKGSYINELVASLTDITVKRNIEKILLGIILISLVSCETKSPSANKNSHKINANKTRITKDTFKISESKNQIDNPVNEYLTEQLEPIRKNFKKLNSIENGNWSSLVTKELDGTNEGGEVTYYHWNNDLDKIVAKEYGETFQVLTEYYFLNGKISFVFQKALKYNRPIYHDSIAMKEMKDNEVFDITKAEIIEERNYFDKGKLIHQLNSEDCGSPMADDFLQAEQKRILQKLTRILKLEKEK